jgi:hypothetical protein
MSFKTSSAVRLSFFFLAFAGKNIKILYFAPHDCSWFAFVVRGDDRKLPYSIALSA